MKNGHRRLLAFLLLFMALPLLAGCWSRREIEDLAVVGAVALDATPGDRVRLSAFIVYPRAIAGGPSMGGGGGGGEPQRVGEVVSATGADFAEATRNLEEFLPRRIFWAQNHVLIIGEELARSGLHHLDFFSRERQMRLTVQVFLAAGEARRVLDVPPGMELAPGVILAGIARNRTALRVELKDLLAMWEAAGDNPVLPRVALLPTSEQESREPGSGGGAASDGGGGETKEQPEALVLKGAGAFRGDSLAGWLDEMETLGLMWLRGEVRRGTVTVALPHLLPGSPPGPDANAVRDDGGPEQVGNPEEGGSPGQGQASVIFRRINTETTARIEGGHPTFAVTIRGVGDLHETTARLDPGRQEHLQALEEAVNREIETRCRAAISKAQQELRADIFGFGEILHRRNVRYWRQVRERWDEEFTRVPIQVQVDLTVRRLGMTNRPAGEKEAAGGKGSTQGGTR